MANIYKVRLSGRGATAAGSTQSPFLTGHLLAISWPGVGSNSTERYSTASAITFSVTPHSSNRNFFKVSLGDKTTGKSWHPSILRDTTAGVARTTFHSMFLPLCRDKIKMNWAASTDKTCAHLDMDLYIDGPPGLEGTS